MSQHNTQDKTDTIMYDFADKDVYITAHDWSWNIVDTVYPGDDYHVVSTETALIATNKKTGERDVYDDALFPWVIDVVVDGMRTSSFGSQFYVWGVTSNTDFVLHSIRSELNMDIVKKLFATSHEEWITVTCITVTGDTITWDVPFRIVNHYKPTAEKRIVPSSLSTFFSTMVENTVEKSYPLLCTTPHVVYRVLSRNMHCVHDLMSGDRHFDAMTVSGIFHRRDEL